MARRFLEYLNSLSGIILGCEALNKGTKMINWISESKVERATIKYLTNLAEWQNSNGLRPESKLFTPPKRTPSTDVPAHFGIAHDGVKSKRIRALVKGVIAELGFPEIGAVRRLTTQDDYVITQYDQIISVLPLRIEQAINRTIFALMVSVYVDEFQYSESSLRLNGNPRTMKDVNFELFLTELQLKLIAAFPRIEEMILARERAGLKAATTHRALRDHIIANFIKGKIT